MNPDLALLQAYPFERLRVLFSASPPRSELAPISLSIGEPRHPTPPFIIRALEAALPGLAQYPSTHGSPALRQSIAAWLARRYGIPLPDSESQVIPVAGTREALFAIAQALIDRSRGQPLVVCPNPFYQIYEGAALLAGAQPLFANLDAAKGHVPDYSQITGEQWARVQLLYVCSPGNPSGAVLALEQWRELFDWSDRYGFVIAADECYSEIYWSDTTPLGALEAAQLLGRTDYRRLLVFASLSKRSNVPGMRSGFVCGDASLISAFLLYRTYHGCALSPSVQAASIAAWDDDAHVVANRALYAQKFAHITPLIASVLPCTEPDAAFYLWARTPIGDEEFARRLNAEYNVSVLPGSYLARTASGINPGEGRVRIALVAEFEECREAARRIAEFTQSL